jgi:spore coat protein A, manganese oxidase
MQISPFQEELPLLSTIQRLPISPADEDWYQIPIYGPIRHDFHPDLKGVEVWGYNGQYPGPVIVARRNRYVQVTWTNDLAANKFPFVPKDQAGGPMPAMHATTKPGHVVVHLHGAHVPPAGDGWPESPLHPSSAGHGEHRATFRYPNRQAGATLWYHDHTMGLTRYNVYAGLAGVYLLREEKEDLLKLPSGNYEVPVVIQDREFDFSSKPAKLGYTIDSANQPEFFGTYIVVNGKVWPKLTVEPRRYRFRVVNGSNSRFYNLSISGTAPVPKAYQIGTDGGFLAAPIRLGSPEQKSLLLAPGERADVLIDFTACAVGSEFTVTNDARYPYPNDPNTKDGIPNPKTDGLVLKFVIGKRTDEDSSCLIEDLALPADFSTDIGGQRIPYRKQDGWSNEDAINSALAKVHPAMSDLAQIRVRTRVLTEDAHKMVLLDSRSWGEQVTETPLLDSIEIWQIDNRTTDTHPIHLHLVQFLVLNRADLSDPNVPDSLPEPNEMGWKDTVRCPPNTRTRIIARFTDYPGWFVWHCHMLEHEDHDMMRPIYVRQHGEPDGVQTPRPEMIQH